MSFIYPRVVAITRPNQQTAVGAVAYSGLLPSDESPIAASLPASIQLDRSGKDPLGQTPSDTDGRTNWRILIPRAAAALGLIKQGDVVTDDLGLRYKVTGPYWNSLGHNLLCELMNT